MVVPVGAAARRGRIAVPPVDPAVRGRVEPCSVGVAIVLVVVIAVQEKAAPTAAPVAVAEAAATAAAVAPEMVGAIVAGAAAKRDRIVVPSAAVLAAAKERAARDPVVAARAPVGMAADPGKAVAKAAPAPEMVAARPGMRKVELVVEIPVAGPVLIGPYLVEEAAGGLCARQRPEAQAYLVEKALAAPFVRHS